jgi:hypothetical protein
MKKKTRTRTQWVAAEQLVVVLKLVHFHRNPQAIGHQKEQPSPQELALSQVLWRLHSKRKKVVRLLQIMQLVRVEPELSRVF